MNWMRNNGQNCKQESMNGNRSIFILMEILLLSLIQVPKMIQASQTYDYFTTVLNLFKILMKLSILLRQKMLFINWWGLNTKSLIQLLAIKLSGLMKSENLLMSRLMKFKKILKNLLMDFRHLKYHINLQKNRN